MGDRNNLQLAMLGTVITVVISLQLQTVLSLPVSIDANGRALRSVTLHRPSPWDDQPVTNLLLSQQQQQQPTHADSAVESIFAHRENKSTDDIATISSTSGDGSYVGEELLGSGDGANANGTLSNDTQVGSRLKQNETEPCSLEPNILCSSDPTHSNRDKQRRIAHIANYVWTNLFRNRTRPINKEIVRERFAPVNPSSSSSFSGDLESIAVSCDLPPEVESEAWSTERNFNLFFNLSSKYPDVFGLNQNVSEQDGQQAQDELQSSESGQPNEFLPITGSQSPFPTIPVTAAAAGKSSKAVNVISAKLRLYKIGSTVPAFTAMVPSEPCNDTESALGLDEEVPTVVTTTATFPERTDEKIRVSIFWYTQPATKNHYKKKLLDAKMLSLGESEWVEFDIKKAAAAWLNDRKPNYGVVVEVENENQDALDPKKYFGGVPCYKTQSSRDPAYQNDENRNEQDGGPTSGGVITTSTSPMIEICTLNVPEMTTNFEQAKAFPYSININSLKHLQQVADSHAKSSDRNGSSQTRLPWQNINLRVISPDDFGITDPFGSDRRSGSSSSRTRRPTSTIVVPSHKHRHHHELNSQNGNNGDSNSESLNQRSRPGVSHPPQVILDEDHPLRGILATVNGNSKEHNKRGSANTGSRRFPESFGKGFPSRNADMAADEGRIESDYLDSTEHERDVFITKIVITPEQLKQNVLNGRSIFPFPTSMSSLSPTGSTSSTGSLSDR